MPKNAEADLEQLIEQDSRYKKAAYLFVFEALHHTMQKQAQPGTPDKKRHISGGDLLRGISELGLDQFGPLTRSVFAHWGVHKTQDFGQIVFNMVAIELMSKREEDRLEDFADVYDFAEEFDWKKRKTAFRKQTAS
ncbi:MAG: hypothetical protein GKR89_17230 [Candidatus Latescibacteria bacterium]|nr:hypothetical protein [Candidatus Latescibacterota bacterium]